MFCLRRYHLPILALVCLTLVSFTVYTILIYRQTALDIEDATTIVSEFPISGFPESNPKELMSSTKKLYNAEKLLYIDSHPEIFDDSLTDLAHRSDEVIDFVYNYPTLNHLNYDTDITEDIIAAENQVPYLSQYDQRWGYKPYGSGLIGYTGCGPTALSMVTVYLTGNPIYTPDYIADYATDNGYCIPGSGTAWNMMYEGCDNLGIHAYSLSINETKMQNALDQNNPIICLMGPGDFTSEGHFIVIDGYTSEGFTIHDPFSFERTNKIWSYDTLEEQINLMWAYYA